MIAVEDEGQRADAPGAKRWARPSRRSVLIAGATLLAGGLTAGTATGTLPIADVVDQVPGETPAAPPGSGVVKVERVWSQARNRAVDLVTLLPSDSPPDHLPVSLLLHGLHGRARAAAPTGTRAALAGQVSQRAVPAFGLVALDGGDNYWHQNKPGDDPMAMLLEELPVWLRQRRLAGVDGLPFACMGLSMGGFGALLYARRRAERRQRLSALALLAPALMTSWSDMSKRHAFHNPADWASMDPLLHPDATQGVPTGVWCGTEDPFIGGVRRFIAETHPAVAYTARGRHGDSFNRTVVPAVIGFLGKHVP
ncbi:alpha/beta hydrolase-fold protein [Amycolatopsis taiwanensis]|uniref:alpha/beta hydrolase-fold protein n=1 Tax=Amycolatopsis taiwanensis TaxID=342230 RepID=UPI000693CEBD|nr:alpha/beta hydrolase-fold protein [Amycolatopsis taiwanensis]